MAGEPQKPHGTGPLPGRGTGPLPPRGSGPLPPRPSLPRAGSGPLPAPPGRPEAPLDEAELASRQRVAFLIGFLDDPESHPFYQDLTKVYTVVSAEREHLRALGDALEAQLATPGAPLAGRVGLLAKRDAAQRREGKLAALLAELVGLDPTAKPREPGAAEAAKAKALAAARILRAAYDP